VAKGEELIQAAADRLRGAFLEAFWEFLAGIDTDYDNGLIDRYPDIDNVISPSPLI
jgi:hypothetical protein